ncbi:hypothetical protein V490_06009 [Pseudogymnoascus sp. VKM F-3557]|nr:hypothetical protein V490_06009 [Pseudogymnoascus sp. VKM F-3557]
MPNTLEAKIVVLGAQGVGKTSLVHRYIHSTFLPPHPSTIGASFLTKRIHDTDSNTLVRLQLWDTAGQERFRSISRLYYRGANACIICYSITDAASFEEMGRWLGELRRELGEGVVLHVVGTKADIVAREPGKREVPFERCIAYVAENLYPALSSTPPLTATAEGAGFGGRARATSAGTEGVRSPGGNSKRSSGFWGQDVGWDCCHEISAESGEGVDEVFRVVTRKLVEQAAKRREEEEGAVEDDGEREGYFDRGGPGRGSFRVGRDRMSWLGFPTGVSGIEEVVEESVPGGQGGMGPGRGKGRGKRCC